MQMGIIKRVQEDLSGRYREPMPYRDRYERHGLYATVALPCP